MSNTGHKYALEEYSAAPKFYFILQGQCSISKAVEILTWSQRCFKSIRIHFGTFGPTSPNLFLLHMSRKKTRTGTGFGGSYGQVETVEGSSEQRGGGSCTHNFPNLPNRTGLVLAALSGLRPHLRCMQPVKQAQTRSPSPVPNLFGPSFLVLGPAASPLGWPGQCTRAKMLPAGLV